MVTYYAMQIPKLCHDLGNEVLWLASTLFRKKTMNNQKLRYVHSRMLLCNAFWAEKCKKKQFCQGIFWGKKKKMF